MAPRATWALGVVLANHSVPVSERAGVAVGQFLRMAANYWASAKTWEASDRALKRARFLLLLERRAGVALHDSVEDAEGAGTPGRGLDGY